MRTSNIDERAAGASRVEEQSREHLPPLAVTMGDPAGIGPDITLASWHLRTRLGLPRFVVHGDPEVLRARSAALGLDTPIAPVADMRAGASVFGAAVPVCAVAAPDANAGIVAAIEQATGSVVGGDALALVTNPITKRALNFPGLAYPGHTEFLAELAARYAHVPKPRPVMMLASEELRVVPATVHIPLCAVFKSLTRTRLSETITTTAAALRADFGVANPRIAVAGLNPHAGEGGLIGDEEMSVIGPVIQEMAAAGLAITGPHAADTLFHAQARQTYDVAIAMYHDQALIPIKTLAFDSAVNITLGLPFVRTSPDHGTATALAGTGKARPGSFIAALRLAHDLGRRRMAVRSATSRP